MQSMPADRSPTAAAVARLPLCGGVCVNLHFVAAGFRRYSERLSDTIAGVQHA
jgi:hypothetical protein